MQDLENSNILFGRNAKKIVSTWQQESEIAIFERLQLEMNETFRRDGWVYIEHY